MKTIVWTTQTAWDDLLRQAENGDVLVMRDGHAVALLTPFNDEDVEWYARERDPDFLLSIAAARQQVAHGKTVSHAELKSALGMN